MPRARSEIARALEDLLPKFASPCRIAQCWTGCARSSASRANRARSLDAGRNCEAVV